MSFKKIFTSSGVNFLFRIFGLGTSFFTTIIITKLFGINTFGNYSLIFAIAQIAALFFTLGIPNTLIKIIGNENFSYLQAKKLLIKGLKGALAFSIIPMFFFYFGATFFSETIFNNVQLKNYFLIISIATPLFVVHEILLYFFIATKKFMKYNFFMFVLPNVLLILFLFLFYNLKFENHFTFIAFSISILLTVLIEVTTIFELKNQQIKSSISTLNLIKTASPLLFSGLFIYLLNNTNIILLGVLSNESQVGIYNIAYKVGSVGFLVIVSVSTIITPKMAELYGQNNLLELKKLTHKATQLIAFLSFPLVLILILFSKFILSFWGENTSSGSTAMIIISIGVLLSAIVGNVDQILNMTNNQKILRNITIFSFFIHIIVSYFLIKEYGINGAAIATLITNVLINVLCLYYIKKKLGFYTLF
ncbi:oligosaccharide flippase family protein [Flavobacterium terrigena]|uniref:Membrane protein involved in the export of O-antigen and teichoic acid n=1 Tax=Flavobacterium terrigena TaxID=402734 RepID=A0A1H6TN50_9FLAO|nr:oligosaccharide flippase family protein [Flavobacterium terrigena]SEI79614.1 Membrane protein involved in the export of O-antigen and teichoic acid [Flavobacterium terrigena]